MPDIKPQPKPSMVEIWEWKNKNTYVKTVTGKAQGGIITFADADPLEPLIWLGDASYILDNQKTKRLIFFYDVIAKTLFKPSELGTNAAETGVLPATVKNVILGGQDARAAIGLQENYNSAMKWTFAIVVVVAIIGMIMVYLIYSHAGGGAPAASAPQTLIHIPVPNTTSG